jgi:hypothetical protein
MAVAGGPLVEGAQGALDEVEALIRVKMEGGA